MHGNIIKMRFNHVQRQYGQMQNNEKLSDDEKIIIGIYYSRTPVLWRSASFNYKNLKSIFYEDNKKTIPAFSSYYFDKL